MLTGYGEKKDKKLKNYCDLCSQSNIISPPNINCMVLKTYCPGYSLCYSGGWGGGGEEEEEWRNEEGG